MSEFFYDAAKGGLRTEVGTAWTCAVDRVMGGVSSGQLAAGLAEGRPAAVLSGEVSLDNGGGFVQARVDLASAGSIDLKTRPALELSLCGDGGPFVVLLKTADLVRPWQSYRLELATTEAWTEHRLDLTSAAPYRTDAPLDLARATSIGLAALGRPGPVRLGIGQLRFAAL